MSDIASMLQAEEGSMASAQIPIRNIYYLLSYAWNHLKSAEVVDVGGLESNELVDLFAHVLVGGTNHLFRRGLDRGYLTHSDDLAGLRGKIDITTTAKRSLLAKAQAHCHYDELSHNVLHNRILKTTIGKLVRTRDLDRHLKHQLMLLYRRMSDVDEVPLSRLVFRRVQLHRNNAFYDFLMNVCELVQENLLVEHQGSGYRFRDFLRDEKKMSRVFEQFVLRFFQREQRLYFVRGSETLDWNAKPYDDDSRATLPKMVMDITLRSPDRTIVIDTKYYREALQTHYGKEKIHSGNLYQIFAYLKNLEFTGGLDSQAEGMLLYPTVEKSLDLKYVVQGHLVRICTIDLAQNWKDIRRDLLMLLRPVSGWATPQPPPAKTITVGQLGSW